MRTTVFTIGVLALAATVAQGQGNLQESARGVSIGSGARAMGMGGAFIAVADDATASSWNPAGLGVLEKREASVVWKARDRGSESVGVSQLRNGYSFHSRFDPPGAPAGASNTFDFSLDERIDGLGQAAALSSDAFDFASVTLPFKVKGLKIVPQANYQRAIDGGYHAYSVRPGEGAALSSTRSAIKGTWCEEGGCAPFDEGTTTSWSSQAHRSFDQQGRGGVDVWAASLALSPHPKVFAGVSFNWWRGTQSMHTTSVQESHDCFDQATTFSGESGLGCERVADRVIGDEETRNRGFNVNVGALVRPVNWLKVGLVYKTPFTMRMDTTGASSLQRVTGTAVGDFPHQSSQSGHFVSDVTWPRTAGLGLAVMPKDTVTLAADFTWSEWSKVTETFAMTGSSVASGLTAWEGESYNDSTQSSQEGTRRWPSLLPLSGTALESTNADQLRGQRDTWQARLGLEVLLLHGQFVLPLRAGTFLDRPWFTDLEGRDVRNWGFTVGAGVTWKSLVLDLAFVHQEYAYGGNYDLTKVTDSLDVREVRRTSLRTERDSRYSADRLYVSTIVRF